MPHIAILSSSVRTGRNSHRVTLYFKHYLESNNLATVEILDLKDHIKTLKDLIEEKSKLSEMYKNENAVLKENIDRLRDNTGG